MLEGQFGHRNSGCQKTIRPLIFWTHMCFGGSTVNVNKANKTKVVREKEENLHRQTCNKQVHGETKLKELKSSA
ncbi:hypothetical protein NC651_017175 [Populus alba x Populus x berolinensis]|nr:hypothetical protein NC651_017175 [Populus alba x Populus x berolinensis]